MITHRHPVRALTRGLATTLVVASLLVTLGIEPVAATPRSLAESTGETILQELHLEARTAPWTFTDHPVDGARPFESWADLRDVARGWSVVQAAGACPGNARICHNDETNGGPGFRNEICCWSRAAENVGWLTLSVAGSTPTAAELRHAIGRLMSAYMNSPPHRDSILDPAFDHFGTSLRLRPAGRGLWTLHSTTVFRQHNGDPIRSVRLTDDAPNRSSTVGGDACSATPDTRFGDVDRSSDVGAAAGCLGDLGITHGLPDGTFGPSAAVTRAQMASFLLRTLEQLGRPPPAAGRSPFTDVSGPHASAVARLHAAGVVQGRPDGTYAPGSSVSRAQMASFLARTYEYAARRPLPSGPLTFRDVQGNPHTDNIRRLAHAGIAAGTGPRTYEPDRDVTRGQMALFLTRLMERYHADR